MKKYICYSCMIETANFYINGNTHKRAAFCGDCCNRFTAKERKKNVQKNILDVISTIGQEIGY